MAKTAWTMACAVLWCVTGTVTVGEEQEPDGPPPRHADVEHTRPGQGESCAMGDFDAALPGTRSYRHDAASPPAAAFRDSSADGDINDDGWVGLGDYTSLFACMAGADQTPNPPPPLTPKQCLATFDSDMDDDVDLVDFGRFQARLGHVPIPLRDTLGNTITIDSTTPYSGRQTCGAGGCHDIDRITNGFKFQQGRTDLDGNVIVGNDYYDDGRWWMRSAGRYGMVSHQGAHAKLTLPDAANESEMDNTTFEWIGNCGGCHPGGGPGEFDQQGERLYDQATDRFGWEITGADPTLHGDYAVLDANTGTVSPAPWDLTGLAEPDCLFCHTPDPEWNDGQNINRRTWRPAILRAKTALVDDEGNSVPAYAAAGAGAQGWFSNLVIQGWAATVLQIDYSVGVAAGTLKLGPDNSVTLPSTSVDRPPRDNACWMCHMGQFVPYRGQVWFDERSIHYAKFNNLRDDDPSNDIAPENSRACTYCHPGDMDHNFAKGESISKLDRPQLNWVNFRSCRDCHMFDSPVRHPEAPDVGGGNDDVIVHLAGTVDRGMMKVLSCQACHIPYALQNASQVEYFGDRFLGGWWSYKVGDFYSADPFNPSDPDKSTFYPALFWKKDSDGEYRLFPGKGPVIEIYWGDWDQNGTPDDRSDDLIAPITRWRFTQVIGNQPLPIVTDDSGDGKPEVNRPEEMLAYMEALKGNDSYGRQVAANPVLVKGPWVWYEDPQAALGVSWFDPDEAGINVRWGTYREWTHTVLAKEEAWGAPNPPDYGCQDCHFYPLIASPVFDRKILIDPWGLDGQPVYTTVREMTGVSPL